MAGITLEVPTNCVTAAPRVCSHGRRLTIEYDHLDLSGFATQGRIDFDGVIAFRYWDGACIPAELVMPPDEVAVTRVSPYLDCAVEDWFQQVGSVQKQGPARSSFRLFAVYFDDAAAMQVIGLSCEASVVGPGESTPGS